MLLQPSDALLGQCDRLEPQPEMRSNIEVNLALALREILARLYKKLRDPDYNYVIHTAAQYKAGEPQLHWYLQVQPRLTTQAGFEIGSGMRINPSVPEEDADFLKGDIAALE